MGLVQEVELTVVPVVQVHMLAAPEIVMAQAVAAADQVLLVVIRPRLMAVMVALAQPLQ